MLRDEVFNLIFLNMSVFHCTDNIKKRFEHKFNNLLGTRLTLLHIHTQSPSFFIYQQLVMLHKMINITSKKKPTRWMVLS